MDIFLPRRDRLLSDKAKMRPQDETNIYDMLAHYVNFVNIAENLFCEDEEKFERFFEKLYNMDRRALALHIRANQDKITKQNLHYTCNYYEMRGFNLREILSDD
jgi:hypothetical protein